MEKGIKFVGLDVHKETIAAAVARADGAVESLGIFANDEPAIRRLVKSLGPPSALRVVYEAGPCGFAVYI